MGALMTRDSNTVKQVEATEHYPAAVYDDVGVASVVPTGAGRKVIEDINKLSHQEMEQEFDKMYQHSQHYLSAPPMDMPCYVHSESLQQCLRRHPRECSQCFDEMLRYRICIYDYMRERIEHTVDPLRNTKLDDIGYH